MQFLFLSFLNFTIERITQPAYSKADRGGLCYLQSCLAKSDFQKDR